MSSFDISDRRYIAELLLQPYSEIEAGLMSLYEEYDTYAPDDCSDAADECLSFIKVHKEAMRLKKENSYYGFCVRRSARLHYKKQREMGAYPGWPFGSVYETAV